MIEMKELGLGLSVAVLLDALLVRGVVLPSLLVLLSRVPGLRLWRAQSAESGIGPYTSRSPSNSVT